MLVFFFFFFISVIFSLFSPCSLLKYICVVAGVGFLLGLLVVRGLFWGSICYC